MERHDPISRVKRQTRPTPPKGSFRCGRGAKKGDRSEGVERIEADSIERKGARPMTWEIHRVRDLEFRSNLARCSFQWSLLIVTSGKGIVSNRRASSQKSGIELHRGGEGSTGGRWKQIAFPGDTRPRNFRRERGPLSFHISFRRTSDVHKRSISCSLFDEANENAFHDTRGEAIRELRSRP